MRKKGLISGGKTFYFYAKLCNFRTVNSTPLKGKRDRKTDPLLEQ